MTIPYAKCDRCSQNLVAEDEGEGEPYCLNCESCSRCGEVHHMEDRCQEATEAEACIERMVSDTERLVTQLAEEQAKVATLVEAAAEAAFWMEVECEHPRSDPHPAMLDQAALLRDAITGLVLAASRYTEQAEQRGAEKLLGNPERLARRFHEAYERLAPDFGYKTREASAVPWEKVPEANRQLMEATCAALLSEDSDDHTTD